MTYRIECPFCSFLNKKEAEDLPWTEDNDYETECQNCDKEFIIRAYISVTHEGIDPDNDY